MIPIEIYTVKNPRWSNSDKQTIDCEITTNTLKEEVPFTASPYDSESHGRDIFFRCMNNEFGPIGEAENAASLEPNYIPELPVELISMNKFLEFANSENSRKSFRSVVIVWDAYLEAELINNLKRWYQGRPEEKMPKRFIFKQVIDNSLKRGLINDKDKKKYHAIREIRNRAAHDWDFSIDSEGVRDHLIFLYKQDHKGAFEYHDDLDFLIQSIYSGSCGMLAMKLIELHCQQITIQHNKRLN